MRTRWATLWVATLAVAAVRAGAARAADDRLLVVVESAPGTGVDAREVRQTVGAELGIPVVAPEDPTAAEASNVLIVTVDKSDIRMSLRGSAAGLVGRTIPAPADRPTRLREIGWLAGNLARDQVSGIVAVPATQASMPPQLPVAAAVEAHATEPPPVAVAPAPPASDPAATVFVRPIDATTSPGPRWTITAAGGPTAAFAYSPGSSTVLWDATYQLEAQHQSSTDGLILGAALDVGTNNSAPGSELFGIAGIVGSSWSHRRWFVETTAGVGLELARLDQVSRTVTSSSLTGNSSVTTETNDVQPVLYLRGIGTLGLALSTSLDLVARFGVHLASSGGSSADFVSTTVGLRYRLP
jgi:hypothetical protein